MIGGISRYGTGAVGDPVFREVAIYTLGAHMIPGRSIVRYEKPVLRIGLLSGVCREIASGAWAALRQPALTDLHAGPIADEFNHIHWAFVRW